MGVKNLDKATIKSKKREVKIDKNQIDFRLIFVPVLSRQNITT